MPPEPRSAASQSARLAVRGAAQKAAIFLVFAGSASCTFDIDGIPVADAAVHASKDAGDPKPDAGSPTPASHADCREPLRADDAEPQDIAIDLHGRPLFDLYRDVGCPEAASIPTCFANGINACQQTLAPGRCLSIPPNPGVCAAASSDKKVFVSYDRGRCIAQLAFATQAAACCHPDASDAFIGIDCRGAWPYPHDGKLGQLCARRADCEPGLSCRHVLKSDFAICSCPEQAREVEAESCL